MFTGLISDTLQKYTYVGSKVPTYLQQLIYSTDRCASVDQNNTIHTNSHSDMLTVSIRMERNGSSHTFKVKLFLLLQSKCFLICICVISILTVFIV